MIDIKSGILKINDQLTIGPNYTFEKFKESNLYKGEDGIRIIYLDNKQEIDGKKYIISLFFKNGVIYLVSLIYCEPEISEKNESERKKIHDEILDLNGIDVNKKYNWGQIKSEYDPRGNISSINIYYDRNNEKI